ncbi:ABC transporter permease [Neokomagataea thailandica]|uniref:ABC transporter n=1 Tax=Neokomagataea tanensis NBRC 106556 TaxID=1223519 RepID=A0ABQ0QLN0_9PROT|nr:MULTISPECIES: ABC transporter permease [Neokomagataea]GBR49475.1 ABC transporter [Neokomagataea tanensis NBRC 106556]
MLKKTSFYIGSQDAFPALREYWLPFVLAWQDISVRYKRSKIGQFWLTINTFIYIASLGVIFGTLFRLNLHEYLPNICAAILTWNFINTSISDGCLAFINSDSVILQIKMPFFTHIIRTVTRNLIVFAHNIVIFPIIALCVGYGINFYALFAIPGLLLILINLLWVCTILAVVCTRFRDLHQVVISLLQIIFYATPVVWDVKSLPKDVSPLFVTLNPFYDFIDLVKRPLMGQPPGMNEWLLCSALAVIGWCVALCVLGKFKHRIAYWL